ncbi:MAG: hypothetical protein MEEGG_02389 [Eggerthella lenta]|mgnify:FL=1
MDEQVSGRPVRAHTTHYDDRAIRDVLASLLERFHDLVPIRLERSTRERGTQLVQVNGVNPVQLTVMLVGAQKLHFAIVQIVQHQGTQDIVEHGIAEHPALYQVANTEPLDGVRMDAAEINLRPIRNQRLELRLRHGLVEEVPLPVQAPHLHQQLPLGFGFHPLRDHADVQQVRHTDDGFQNATGFAALRVYRVQQLHVQFQDVDVHVLQHAKRRIPAAKIVHMNGDAQVMETLDDVHDQLAILDVRAFGDFDGEQTRGNIILFDQSLERAQNIERIQVAARHVHGNGHGRLAGVHPRAQSAEHFLPNMQIERGYQPISLQHGDKLDRRDEPALRVHPANQSLEAHDLARVEVAFRLSVERDLALLQSLLHFEQKRMVVLDLSEHTIVVPSETLSVIPLDRGQSQQRAIVHDADGQGPIVNAEQPERGKKAHAFAVMKRALSNAGSQSLDHALVAR